LEKDNANANNKCELATKDQKELLQLNAGEKKYTNDQKDCKDTDFCCNPATNTCAGQAAVAVGKTCTTGVHSGSDAAWKKKAVANPQDQAAFDAACCAAKATCAQATCPAGYKKRANQEKTTCTGLVATCTTTNLNTCCQKDDQKCGGLDNIYCKYGFYDERNFWVETEGATKTPQSTKDAWNNKAGNETNKGTNCCTPRAICKLPGSTTPAPTLTPAVTTTPVAPALKFSEHKVATADQTADRPWAANMVWLGVGGLIGMGVIMAVQGLRSRMSAPVEDEDSDDADALLNTVE